MVSTVLPSNSSIVSSVLGLGQSKSACNCFKTATKSSILAARSCSRANQPTCTKIYIIKLVYFNIIFIIQGESPEQHSSSLNPRLSSLAVVFVHVSGEWLQWRNLPRMKNSCRQRFQQVKHCRPEYVELNILFFCGVWHTFLPSLHLAGV